MLRLLYILIFTGLISQSVIAEDQRYFRVGQLVKCSYKGDSESTKTVECQLRQGLNSSKIWQFSATSDDWDKLVSAAGKQVLLQYRTGGINHMESSFSLLSVKVLSKTEEIKPIIKKSVNNAMSDKTPKDQVSVDKVIKQSSSNQSICAINIPKESYSVGFRVVRLVSAENIDERWTAQGQLGGDGGMALWAFEIRKKDNEACYQQLLDVMSNGKKRVFYYHQKDKNGIYKIWRID